MQSPLIFTDLDGTLLDHHTYSFDAAIPTLKHLGKVDIPVIATTSKTYEEVIGLYDALDISGPFIIENGAAIFIPKHFFPTQPEQTIAQGDYWLKTFSQPRENYIAVVEKLVDEFGHAFRSFYQMTANEIAEVTNLSIASAKLANLRQFGEPVLWRGSDKEKQAFIKEAKKLGANILIGGRFIHVCGDCDKGKALHWLTREYQRQFKLSKTTAIALGDSGNDIAMLEAADIAVQIKSPTHSYPILDQCKVSFVYQTQGFGPVGWSEALSFILDFSSFKRIDHVPTGGFSHG